MCPHFEDVVVRVCTGGRTRTLGMFVYPLFTSFLFFSFPLFIIMTSSVHHLFYVFSPLSPYPYQV
ncbi:hypothetical protein L873DRAFT_1179716 [Choiromyces venosus 120613-1]|uniref:Uncharacterized protein n=1 Tax=Choiromyces venosus 120613-1 TaxID=1336337 RepID=A0A3N4K2U5_9PEZI|nr:hypothetical protein L873DRAFT_1179716 [Choiromyces venosus 120613-1]